jgi:hypothetical protein
MKNKVKQGDWVTAENEAGEVFTGYVVQISGVTAGVYFMDDSFVPFKLDQLAVCPVYLKEEEVDTLIDLALLIKDKEWFEELIKEKEKFKCKVL